MAGEAERWDARVRALEAVLGPAEDRVLHRVVPLELGLAAGGGAHVLRFRSLGEGTLYVTCGLLGHPDQKPSSLGHYELAIAHRDEEPWGPEVVSDLAAYTFEEVLEPGDTMDVSPCVPEGSSITSLLFLELARLDTWETPAGVLLCLGITAEERMRKEIFGAKQVARELRERGVHPFTDLTRKPRP